MPNAEKSILINDITNQGTINTSNIQLNINGQLINNGDINCKVNIYGCGDPLFDVYFSKPLYQGISGSGTISELYFNNNTTRGVGIHGKQKVTKFLSTGKQEYDQVKIFIFQVIAQLKTIITKVMLLLKITIQTVI